MLTGCTSPSLSNKNEYALFSRTVAPETSKGPTLAALMGHYNWRKITILTSVESLWFESRLGIAKQLKAAGMDVLMPAAFEPGDFKDATLSEIKRSGRRVVFVLAYDEDLQVITATADREGMLGPGWAWLCTDTNTATVILGWLWLRPFLAEGMETFAKLVRDYATSHLNHTVSADAVDHALTYSVKLHDAILLYAHAATKVLAGNLHDGDAVTEAIRSTTFMGVGGAVALDEQGDPIESYEVINSVLGLGGVMNSVPVGMYSSTANATLQQYKAYKQTVLWPGSSTEVPKDWNSDITCTAGSFFSKEARCIPCEAGCFTSENYHLCDYGLYSYGLYMSLWPCGGRLLHKRKRQRRMRELQGPGYAITKSRNQYAMTNMS